MIHILSTEIANRIAAGEVVERPASVVRELIDNAVDAGARRIDVEIEQGGLQSIRVTDDGCGMDREDAVLCPKRHATSKIRNAEDLNAILTKGFRGEALAAISSIARFELKTRPADQEFGTAIRIEGGQEFEPQSVGIPVGTTVTIRDLFYNTPARRKFLKKPATEMNHVLSTLTWNALAHETIHFTFSHNGRRSLDFPIVASRADRIRQIFGKQVLEEMIPVQMDTPAVSLTGFISRPTLSRNGAQHIFFFVNNRYVKDRLLHRALMNGYRNLIHAGRYPVAFLYLELDPGEIDINVHPTKQEVKFSHEDAVFSATYGAIRQAWDVERNTDERPPLFDSSEETSPEQDIPESSSAPIQLENPRLEEKPNLPSVPKPPVIQHLNREFPQKKFSPEPEQPLRVPFPQEEPMEKGKSDESISPPIESPEPEPEKQRIPASPFVPPPQKEDALRSIGVPPGALRDLIQVEKRADTLFETRSLEESGELVVLGQMMRSYILAEGKDGLYIIDQHAAHERLLFEQFLEQSQKAPLASQALLFPITLEFSPEDAALVEEIMDLMQSLGFSIEPFGGNTFVARSIPASLTMNEAEQFIKDFLGEVRHEGSASEYHEKALHTLACRAAVKFGDELTQAEMEGIIQGLQQIPRRNVCPHGRPALLFIAEPALQKAFKRTGF